MERRFAVGADTGRAAVMGEGWGQSLRDGYLMRAIKCQFPTPPVLWDAYDGNVKAGCQ